MGLHSQKKKKLYSMRVLLKEIFGGSGKANRSEDEFKPDEGDGDVGGGPHSHKKRKEKPAKKETSVVGSEFLHNGKGSDVVRKGGRRSHGKGRVLLRQAPGTLGRKVGDLRRSRLTQAADRTSVHVK